MFIYIEGIKRLVALLKMTDHHLILSTLSVLCNISITTEVRLAISSVNENLSEMFSNLLKLNNDEIRSKTSILMADICFIPSNQVNRTNFKNRYLLFLWNSHKILVKILKITSDS